MLFYQIYDELQNLNIKYNNLEEILMETFKVTRQNRKREEKLYQRVCLLEETNEKLLKEVKHMALKQDKAEERIELYKEQNNGLIYNHNTMIATINTIITELNDVISVLNNKHQENYYVLRVFCKKSFFEREIFENKEKLKKHGIF